MSRHTHVFPVDDLIDHELDGDSCVCGPTVELVQTGHGDEWLVTHHSLDGRELRADDLEAALADLDGRWCGAALGAAVSAAVMVVAALIARWW